MKILFVCGSLEPTKDGVGDYVRRLAVELTRQGSQVALLAINDKFINRQRYEWLTAEGLVNIAVLRIPAMAVSKTQLQYAKQWIEEFNPDWVSLQFVPFSFQPKGLVVGLGGLLKKLLGNRPLHVMFHELWVGMEKSAPQKLVMWGWLQKQLIIQLLQELKPAVIHTHTRLYILQLAQYRFNAQYLPLFGNIPPVVESRPAAQQQLKLIHFGTIYPHAPIKEFAAEAALYARSKGLELSITVIGHAGPELERWKQICASAGVTFSPLGSLPAEQISRELAGASIGIATTAYPLIEKSGSAAAIREHGLPIICVAKPWQPRGGIKLKPLNEIAEYTAGNFAACIERRQPSGSRLSAGAVARQFTDTLIAVSKKSSNSVEFQKAGR